MSTGLVQAVDLGGTKTAIALVDETGRIHEKLKIPAAKDFAASVGQIVSRLGELRPSACALGVIVPGIHDASNGTVWAPNLWGKDFHPLRAELEQRLGIPVAIGSDRTGSVLAEQWLGVARGLRHVIFVAVGTGIGVGILCDGRPVEGAHGIAGAAGWMTVAGPWKPAYAERGGWETIAAGPALARYAEMESAESVAAAARDGNPKARVAIARVASWLALGIGNLIAVLDPEIVVLGGGVMQASDLMLASIRKMALMQTQPMAARQVRIELTALGEDAGLLGAARLAWNARV